MTIEEIKEKYSRDEDGYIYCSDCPLAIVDENSAVGMTNECLGYDDFCDGHEEAYARIQQYLNCQQYLSDKKNTVILYIDWKKKDIISEREYEETADLSDENFSKWLNLNYNASEVYDMDGIDRQDVYNKFCETAKKDSEKIRSDYERVEVSL